MSEYIQRQRKPLSLLKKSIIVIFCVVSGFGIYDTLFPIPTPKVDPIKDWKTYKNADYHFSAKYPSTTIVYQLAQDGSIQDTKTFPVSVKVASNSVMFTPDQKLAGPPLYYVKINPFSQETTDKIFDLKIDGNLDKHTSNELSGKKVAGVYKRLPDEKINGNTFLVLENPQGYSGRERLLLIKNDGSVYMTGLTYQNEEKLYDFYLFYSSLKFN